MKPAYRDPAHEQLPHVLNFSGGRSSGYMLLRMLGDGGLRRERGDVVIFSNTSAEHPATYDFVARCAAHTEEMFIPFFCLEFCTYETGLGKRARSSSGAI